jgi:hypothetical protein
MIDGASAVNLVREILEAWDAGAAGRILGEPEVLELAPAVEDLFPPEYRGLRAKLGVARFFMRQIVDEIGYRWRARGTRKMPVHERSQCRVLNRVYGGDDLERLVRATRRHRVTLNSAINAAMLIVVQRRLYDGSAVPLRNFIMGVMRPYLDPPLTAQHLGSHFVMLRSTTDVGADQDFWELASRINRDYVAAAKRGDKHYSLLTVRKVMQMLLGQRKMRMSATALAYTGPIKLREEIGATVLILVVLPVVYSVLVGAAEGRRSFHALEVIGRKMLGD